MVSSNYEYLKQFIHKHGYKEQVHIQCLGSLKLENIKSVVFHKDDIPTGWKINFDDIKYDIDSDLPRDVFFRWLEFCDKRNGTDIGYIYWMTKMDNAYEPMNVDKSESEKFRKEITGAVSEIKKLLFNIKKG